MGAGEGWGEGTTQLARASIEEEDALSQLAADHRCVVKHPRQSVPPLTSAFSHRERGPSLSYYFFDSAPSRGVGGCFFSFSGCAGWAVAMATCGRLGSGQSTWKKSPRGASVRSKVWAPK